MTATEEAVREGVCERTIRRRRARARNGEPIKRPAGRPPLVDLKRFREVWRACRGDVNAIAESLGISTATCYRYLEKIHRDPLDREGD